MNTKIIGLMVIFLVSLPLVFSLRAALGSANAALTVDVFPDHPTIVNRYVTVINQNNESVKIELFPAEELVNITEMVDTNFTLLPGEARNASFRFVISQPDDYKGSIRVKFIPADRIGAGVGLDATYRIFAIAKNETSSQTETPREVPSKNHSNISPPPNETNNGAKANWVVGVILIVIIIAGGIGAYFALGKKK